jgi:hypothetical protein
MQVEKEKKRLDEELQESLREETPVVISVEIKSLKTKPPVKSNGQGVQAKSVADLNDILIKSKKRIENAKPLRNKTTNKTSSSSLPAVRTSKDSRRFRRTDGDEPILLKLDKEEESSRKMSSSKWIPVKVCSSHEIVKENTNNYDY